MVRPQNIVRRAPRPTADGNSVRGRLIDIMVSGSLTKLYMERRDAGHAAAGRRLSDARAARAASRSASRRAATGTRRDAVAIADEARMSASPPLRSDRAPGRAGRRLWTRR